MRTLTLGFLVSMTIPLSAMGVAFENQGVTAPVESAQVVADSGLQGEVSKELTFFESDFTEAVIELAGNAVCNPRVKVCED